MTKRGVILLVAVALAAGACAQRASSGGGVVRVGAVYPLTGPQGAGGLSELNGVKLAAEFANDQGGIGGRKIELVVKDAPSADAAPAAVDALASQGVRFVIGGHGSAVSAAAAVTAARQGMVYWETGAVGDMIASDQEGRLIFRFSPTGPVLGQAAIAFIADQLAPRLHRAASSLRFAVANVDDAYGAAVARGAIDEIHRRGLPYAGSYSYDLRSASYQQDLARVADKIGAAKADVVFAAAYVDDGVALRQMLVRKHVRLVTGIGTSSSYCMPAFGQRLGVDGVGLFASDKPDWSINPSGLLPDARALLAKANAAYKASPGESSGSYGDSEGDGGGLDAPELAGFSAAWALFHDVMPSASALTPVGVAAAARAASLPAGSLPNGSGMAFGAPGTATAGANVRAASVIWEWIRPGVRVIVWPPAYATHPIQPLPVAA